MTDIIDSRGRVNTDIDPATIPPDRRAQFVALVNAQALSDTAESSLKIADEAVAAAVKEHDRAHAAVPVSTPLQEQRAAAAAWAAAHGR